MTSDRRRLLMAIRGATTPPPPPLPAGYTALAYVENPLGNSAYINTGVPTGNNIGFFIDALPLDGYGTVSANYGCLFGARYSGSSSEYQLTTYSPSPNSGTIATGSTRYNAHLPHNVRFQASLEGTIYSVGGNDYTVARDVADNRHYNIYLFALNYRNSSTQQNGHVRVWRFWLTDNGTKVLDYYPCRRDADNVVGFYDLVADAFVPPTSGTLTGVL